MSELAPASIRQDPEVCIVPMRLTETNHTQARSLAMQSNTRVPALTIGIVGTAIVGILTRDLLPMTLGTFVVGIVAGLVGQGSRRAVPLGIGIALALPLLIAIQFGTPIGTFMNTDDPGELAGVAPLVVLVWALVVGAGLAGFAAATLGRRYLRQASPT